MIKTFQRRYFSFLRSQYTLGYGAALRDLEVKIRENLASCLKTLNLGGRSISIYAPLHGEIDIRPVLKGYSKNKILYPCCNKKGALTFRPDIGKPWVRDTFGLPVPILSQEFIPHCIIAPVVCFDARGYRVGYGGGFYDRALKELKDIICIYVAYSFQETQKIHNTDLDFQAQIVCTDRGNFFIKKENE